MSQEKNEKWFIIETWNEDGEEYQYKYRRTLKVTNELPKFNNKEVEKEVMYKINDKKSFIVHDDVFPSKEAALRTVKGEIWYNLDNLKVDEDEYQDPVGCQYLLTIDEYVKLKNWTIDDLELYPGMEEKYIKERAGQIFNDAWYAYDENDVNNINDVYIYGDIYAYLKERMKEVEVHT